MLAFLFNGHTHGKFRTVCMFQKEQMDSDDYMVQKLCVRDKQVDGRAADSELILKRVVFIYVTIIV